MTELLKVENNKMIAKRSFDAFNEQNLEKLLA